MDELRSVFFDAESFNSVAHISPERDPSGDPVFLMFICSISARFLTGHRASLMLFPSVSVAQSSSIARHLKILKNIGKDVEELKQGSTKRNASAIEDIKREMKKLKQNTMEDIKRNVEKLNQNASPATDVFKRYFDIPYLGSNLVFDFDSHGNNGNFITPEGILLNSVLQPGKEYNLQGASALETHGMGGVDKTKSLKKICCAERIRSQFADEVCFMQFGQDASVQKFTTRFIVA